MDLAYLIRFAQSMARPAFAYRPAQKGQTVEAYWCNKQALILTVIYQDQWYALQHAANNQLEFTLAQPEQLQQGVALSKQEYASYPCIEHVFHYGDAPIYAWLEHQDWDSDEGYNDNFPDPAADRYDRWWQQQDPLYSSDPDNYLVSAGWSVAWPDDDDILEWDIDLEFVLRTQRDNEPYYEVWYNKVSGKFIALERGT